MGLDLSSLCTDILWCVGTTELNLAVSLPCKELSRPSNASKRETKVSPCSDRADTPEQKPMIPLNEFPGNMYIHNEGS